jgi:Flp pilus assembly protein TadG
MVEMALVMPILVILTGIAFNGWSAMQASIRLTAAVRAGTIAAANDLAAPNNTSSAVALAAATLAINQEEGVVNVYQSSNPAADNYVTISAVPTTDSLNGTGVTISVVTIKIAHLVTAWVPVLQSIHVTTTATARYA